MRDCYAALGAVHARWDPVPGRFTDYIAMPTFNMYQALHTTVGGPGGDRVELHIRTWSMHRRAEQESGVYPGYQDEATTGADGGTRDLAWLRLLVDWQREGEGAAAAGERLRSGPGDGDVYMFTVHGDVIPLPPGSTPVDLAYAIHTEVGHRTIGARVNGRLVALKSTLSNGDTVEIFTSKADEAGPTRDWLKFAKSPQARNKIREWFSNDRREAAMEAGRDHIARVMRKQGLQLQRQAATDTLTNVATELRFSDVSSLYRAVGEGMISAQSVVGRLAKWVGGPDVADEDLSEAGRPAAAPQPPAPGVDVTGAPDVWVRISQCCNPARADPITGFVTHGNGVSVHRADCANLTHLTDTQRERLVEVRWTPAEDSPSLVVIQVEALDRTRLLSDVTRTLVDYQVNVLSASVTTSRDRVAVCRFTFEMGDPRQLTIFKGGGYAFG